MGDGAERSVLRILRPIAMPAGAVQGHNAAVSELPAPAYSHTVSLRLADGAEVLVVRVLTREGVAGYGFTFREDVAAARAMACWDAAARAAGQPLWRLLAEDDGAARAAGEAPVDAGSHPWSVAWRAVLAGTPGAAIDWTLEPGFTTLRWIEPEPKEEERHGRTAD